MSGQYASPSQPCRRIATCSAMTWEGRSMDESITVRPAFPGEVGTIASMWREASSWLRSQGSDQWQYPPDLEKISRDVRRGTAYIAHRRKAYLGTITLDDFADPEFWSDADSPRDALYGHRIIVLPSAQGFHVGSALLDWASKRARAAGKSWLRVDAWKTNEELGRYYERLDFDFVRRVDLPHRRSGALYQRSSDTMTNQGPKVVHLEMPQHDINGNPSTEGAWGHTSPA
ncbi:GNAT family N-acetyltransferase [Streptomyces sp. NPDC047108]|uniref:GNAT family N-acetyltransferase n=1 Tax=Streptomyces sp. NPDC047108 TaxID=3155025 RepID=UPI0033D2739C